MRQWLALALLLPALAAGGGFAPDAAAQAATLPGPAGAATATSGQFVTLDHVVAVIDGEVLLESDVDEEMRFAALEPFQPHAGRDTRQDALHRLVSRVLIVQQMKAQRQFDANTSDADVEKSLKDLRSHLPQCAKYKCETAEGWKAFLAANGLTSAEVVQHWKERLTILRFIDVRFRTGIRISHESIADYYQKTVVPAFTLQHQKAPPLNEVSSRIQEVLLQQQVNGLLRDWLRSLRTEGSLQIVDPAYVTPENSSDTAKGEED